MDQYSEAHLYTAAIRVMQHLKHGAPSIEDICRLLDVSVESALAVCRRLQRRQIVELIDDPFTVKVVVGDHLAIESLPRKAKNEDALTRELEQFMAKKKEMNKKVESIQADMEKKRQSLFNDMEEQLKKKMADMKKG